jgi:hypothetical protein
MKRDISIAVAPTGGEYNISVGNSTKIPGGRMAHFMFHCPECDRTIILTVKVQDDDDKGG